MNKKIFNLVELTNNDGCFDLQFRKDTRHERANSPTYYRWKAQFIITTKKEYFNLLRRAKKEFGCGNITASGAQARFCVQKIEDIFNIIIPYFKKNSLQNNKKRDFELWSKGVNIIFQNKGKHLTEWKKADIYTLIEIHKSSAKYKNKPRQPKWLDVAKNFIKTN
jgi:hypothetical protein